MTDRKRYPKRLNVYVTAEMQRKLEQVRDQRGPQTTVPDVVREAIRLLIDDQEQVIGSRRHFQKTLREEITAIRDAFKDDLAHTQIDLVWGHLFILILTANSLAPLISRVTGQPVTVDNLLTYAAAQTKQHWPLAFKLLTESQDASSGQTAPAGHK